MPPTRTLSCKDVDEDCCGFYQTIVKTMQILHNHNTTMMMIVMIMISVARLENQ